MEGKEVEVLPRLLSSGVELSLESTLENTHKCKYKHKIQIQIQGNEVGIAAPAELRRRICFIKHP